MFTFAMRRLAIAIPTLLFISLIVFLLLNLAPNDPMAQVPLTVPPEVKQKMREALGLGQPLHVQYFKWLVQFFWIEPQVLIDHLFNTQFSKDDLRVISWQTRSPVMDVVVQRLPQTLWVVGMAYLVGILIALPIGIYSAYRQYSVFDQVGTFVAMIGYSVPPFFSGVAVIVLFAVQLGWLPSTYNTLHEVVSWDSFIIQLKQMVLPVMVLALQTTAQLSRFMRASVFLWLGFQLCRSSRFATSHLAGIRSAQISPLKSVQKLLSHLLKRLPSALGSAEKIFLNQAQLLLPIIISLTLMS